MQHAPGLNAELDQLIRADRGRLLAALISSLGDFELAEEGLSDAVESALIHWARIGIPANPHGWLLQVARRKAIDRIRRAKRFRDRIPELARLAQEDEMDANSERAEIPDQRLRLIFTCCHPAIEPKTRVALTLRTIGGLSTAEIATAFLDRETAMAQRLSRARKKIGKAGIPFAMPEPDMWDERLNSVLAVIYLIFNEGHSASSGSDAVRVDLCDEAVFLARLLNKLKPEEPEIEGLLSLLLTTHARRVSSVQNGNAIAAGKAAMIGEGCELLDAAMSRLQPGPYQIKAAISALHSSAETETDIDWNQIALLYDRLLGFEPTAVVRLNRAVAHAEAVGPEPALAELDRLAAELHDYQPYHAARAELLTRAKRLGDAHESYQAAIDLTGNEQDRAFLKARQSRIVH